MNIIKYLSLIIGCSIGWMACNTEESDHLGDEELGLNYYPVALGKFWDYRLDSVWYKLSNQVEQHRSVSFIREEIVDTFRDVTGQLIYRLDVFQSTDTVSGWELIDSYFLETNDRLVVKREKGLSYIKLVFPPQTGKSWNGNIHIHPKTQINIQGEFLEPFDQWLYYFEYVDRNESINGIHYKDVCKVVEVDDENIIQKRYSSALYSRNVGLIYKELLLLETQNTDTSVPFEDRAEKGMILKQTLVSHN